MATGDVIVRRLSAGGNSYNSTAFTDVNYSTTVYADAIYGGSGTAISCSDAGHYLVAYQWASEDDNGNNRSETRGRIVVNNSDAFYGDSSGYIRRTGGVNAWVQAATTILNLSASDTVGVEIARTDSNTADGDTMDQAGLSGISIVKLPDTADFFRARRTTNATLNSVAGQSPPVSPSSFNYSSIGFTTQDEADAAYTHSTSTNNDQIQLDAGTYIVCYQAEIAGSGSARRNAIARLTLNGSEIPGSYTTGYVRQQNGVNHPVCSGQMLVEASANDILRLQVAIDAEQSPVTDVVCEAAYITIMKLPTAAGYAMLRQSADHDHNTTSFDAISFNTQDALDSTYWGHSGSQVTRQRSTATVKPALIMGGFFHVRDAVNATRKNPEFQWRIDGTTAAQLGGAVGHNRGDQSTSGTWTAGAAAAWVWDVNTGSPHYIEMGGLDRATTTDASTSWEAGQTFLHALDLEAAFAAGSSPQTVPVTGIASSEAFGTPTVVPGGIAVTVTGIASAEAFGVASAQAGATTVIVSGIASSEAFGTPSVTVGSISVATTGIASAEAFGVPSVSTSGVSAAVTGIPSAEAFGTPTASLGALSVAVTGIPSAEAFGTPTAALGAISVAVSGIPSAEAFGTPTASLGTLSVAVTGIPSAEAFGTPAASLGALSVAVTGIPSAEAFGTPTASLGAISVAVSGIPSAEAFGAPTASLGALSVAVSGIPSAEAFGTPTASLGALSVAVSGIPSAEAFGTPTASLGALSVAVSGIPSAEAFGTPTASLGALSVAVSGIPSAEAFGTPTASLGALSVAVSGIPSAEAFGTPTASLGAISVSVTGIPSAEAFGTPTASTGALTASVTGIASAEAFGTPTISVGAISASVTGIPSAEAFGAPTASLGAIAVSVTGIPSAEAIGTPTASIGALSVSVTGIASAEAFGSPSTATGGVSVTATGIPSAEAFGTATASAGALTASVTGIPSEEAFGSPTVTDLTVTVTVTAIPSAEAFGTPTASIGGVTVSGIASGEAFGTPTVSVGGITVSLTGIVSAEAFGTATALDAEMVIQVNRGLNSSRLSTLGTPVVGEPIYCTDTKTLFIGDGTTAGALPATKPCGALQATTSLTTDINAASTNNLVGWDTQEYLWGADITHDTATNNSRVSIAYDGLYEISVTVRVSTSSATNYNGVMRCRLNGLTDFGPSSATGFISGSSGNNEASFQIANFIYQFSGSDYFEVKIDREATTSAAVNLVADQSYLYIKRIA